MTKETAERWAKEINRMFEGEILTVHHPDNPELRYDSGTFKTAHVIPGGVDIEISNGRRYDVIPETLTERALVGGMSTMAGRRIIKVV